MDILNETNCPILQGLVHPEVKHHLLRIDVTKEEYRFVLKNKRIVGLKREAFKLMGFQELSIVVSTKIKAEAMSNVYILGASQYARPS